MKNLKITQIGLQKSLFSDVYYRVLKASWLKFFIFSAICYLVINFIFALLYYFSPAEILNVRPGSLWDAFIFSFQTSSTVGYGYFLPKSDTAHAIVMLDTMVGIFYVAIVTGLAFAKFARPSAQILFSNNIIHTTFDGIPTLMFRVANGRDTHIVDANLNVAVLLPYTSKEGHNMRRFYPLKLMSNNNPTFTLSWTVMHQITEESPLFGLSLEQFKEKKVLVFASLTGIDDVISQTVHANNRYTTDKFIKANKFVDILSDSTEGDYILDFNKFHDVEA